MVLLLGYEVRHEDAREIVELLRARGKADDVSAAAVIEQRLDSELRAIALTPSEHRSDIGPLGPGRSNGPARDTGSCDTLLPKSQLARWSRSTAAGFVPSHNHDTRSYPSPIIPCLGGSSVSARVAVYGSDKEQRR